MRLERNMLGYWLRFFDLANIPVVATARIQTYPIPRGSSRLLRNGLPFTFSNSVMNNSERVQTHYTLNIYPRMWKNRNSPPAELPLYRNRRRRHTATCVCVYVCVCVSDLHTLRNETARGRKTELSVVHETSLATIAWIIPAES